MFICLGMKQLLTDNPKVIETSLFDITSSIGRLLTDEVSVNNNIIRNPFTY